ncbi:hypothetical protein C8A01DRAFT_34687 [Parachaetomium inaequale]|uniref:WD-like domain-containing protein n=1 Tax=Parachaetomium inaequale TaxID=2588326 RepID=A0AAN6PML9_9PEZI|nr:hypothetical protein C8A01DRAFT_34687 [Parachaetomium inaequale]
MQLKTLTAAALLAALPAFAIPTAEVSVIVEDGLVLLDKFEIAEGTITTYAVDPAHAASTVQLTKRCGSNKVTCDGSHVPPFNTCQDLVSSIIDNSRVLASNPRSICLNRNGGNCCISWSKDIGNVVEQDLWSAAQKSLSQCVSEGKSAKASDVTINGQCLNQCLSNRASNC